MEFPDMLQSALADKPEHIQAIGLITVEIAHLEHASAELFAAVSGVHWAVAEAIYFTPKSTMARLDFISNVASLTMHRDEDKKYLNKISRLIERAKSAMGKRHKIMHGYWALSDDLNDVQRLDLPRFKTGAKMTISDLTSIVEQVQRLNSEIFDFCDEIRSAFPRPEPPLKEYWKR